MMEKIAKITEIIASILVVVIFVTLTIDNFEDIIPDSQKTQLYLDMLMYMIAIILLRINRNKK